MITLIVAALLLAVGFFLGVFACRCHIRELRRAHANYLKYLADGRSDACRAAYVNGVAMGLSVHGHPDTRQSASRKRVSFEDFAPRTVE